MRQTLKNVESPAAQLVLQVLLTGPLAGILAEIQWYQLHAQSLVSAGEATPRYGLRRAICTQCCFDVGPTARTPGQLWNNIGPDNVFVEWVAICGGSVCHLIVIIASSQ